MPPFVAAGGVAHQAVEQDPERPVLQAVAHEQRRPGGHRPQDRCRQRMPPVGRDGVDHVDEVRQIVGLGEHQRRGLRPAAVQVVDDGPLHRRLLQEGGRGRVGVPPGGDGHVGLLALRPQRLGQEVVVVRREEGRHRETGQQPVRLPGIAHRRPPERAQVAADRLLEVDRIAHHGLAVLHHAGQVADAGERVAVAEGVPVAEDGAGGKGAGTGSRSEERGAVTPAELVDRTFPVDIVHGPPWSSGNSPL